MKDPYRRSGNPESSVTSVKEPDEDLFRLLVHSVKDYAIFLLDPKGVVISWNEGVERIQGYAAHEIIGRHFSTFYPQDAIDRRWPERELAVAQAEGRFEDEGWRVRKDGTLFWADVVITPLYGPTKELRGFAKVTRDLTERKMAEEALRQSEEHYRLLVESARDYAILMLDPNGIILTWNRGAERLKGYTAGEIIGQHFSKFYPRPAVDSGWPEKELEIASTEGRFEDEGWRVRKDGSHFWANVVITALRDGQGSLRGFSKITRDMTDRRNWEQSTQKLNGQLNGRVEELAESNRSLAQKSEENETFVYSVSHDVRAPLVNLQGFSQELRLSCDDLHELLASPPIPEQIRNRAAEILKGSMAESIRYMQGSVLHLSKIVDALLRLSRAGRVVYKPIPVDATALVKRVTESMQGSIAERAAEVVIHDLPPALADPVALEQVFNNLITNALHYAEPSRRLRIEIGGIPQPAGEHVVYYVKDNGLGIPAAAIPTLFSAFQRHYPGVAPREGMGLAMIQRIVDRHHGKIWVESAVGAGATFYIELPAGGRR